MDLGRCLPTPRAGPYHQHYRVCDECGFYDESKDPMEGASSALDISRDDIDGATFHLAADTMALVLFDTVPGGAGLVAGTRFGDGPAKRPGEGRSAGVSRVAG